MPAIDLDLLDSLSRDELIERARKLGAKRPEVMTRVELRDEIIRLSEPDVVAQKKVRGWLGVARDLVASVVESGLNLKDAAALIRGDQRSDQEWHGPPAVATVTLAEIYVAQGHPERALAILDEVLEREPDHGAASALRDRLRSERGTAANRRRGRVPEAEPVTPRPPRESWPSPMLDSEVPPVVVPPEGDRRRSIPPAPESEPPEDIEAAIETPRTSPLESPALAPTPAAVTSASTSELACVLVQQGSGWLARWQTDPALRELVLRVLAFVPRAPEPEEIRRDITIEAAQGSCEIAGLPAQAVVRAALGRLIDGQFTPLAVAPVIGDAGVGRQALYRPPGQDSTALERTLLSV
jgi:hypothetical protein